MHKEEDISVKICLEMVDMEITASVSWEHMLEKKSEILKCGKCFN